MVAYNLAHLIQPQDQNVSGPIQDDEALFLYAIIRCTRVKRILEVGGHESYSALNFIKAMQDGIMYTVDIHDVPAMHENHRIILKDAIELTAADVDNKRLDMVFFDCHVYEAQMTAFKRLREFKIIDNKTILALHDTNLSPNGYIHQPVERRMVNEFREMGYDTFSVHTDPSVHSVQSENLPFRHGVTVCQMFEPLTF